MNTTNIHKELESFSIKHSLKLQTVTKPFPLGKKEEFSVIDKKTGKVILYLKLRQSASSSVVNKVYVLKASFDIKDTETKITIKAKSFFRKIISFFKSDNFPFEIKEKSISPLIYSNIKLDLSKHLYLSQLTDFVCDINEGTISIYAKSYYEDFISEALIFCFKVFSNYSEPLSRNDEKAQPI